MPNTACLDVHGRTFYEDWNDDGDDDDDEDDDDDNDDDDGGGDDDDDDADARKGVSIRASSSACPPALTPSSARVAQGGPA